MSQTQPSHDVLRFWFEELEPAQWWQKDAELDRQIADRFGEIHQSACRCELFSWRDSARGRLAEIIVLDQFSRQYLPRSGRGIRRRSAGTGSGPGSGGGRARPGADYGRTKRVCTCRICTRNLSSYTMRRVRLYQAKGLEYNLEFEHKHRVIIERFGRYPHPQRHSRGANPHPRKSPSCRNPIHLSECVFSLLHTGSWIFGGQRRVVRATASLQGFLRLQTALALSPALPAGEPRVRSPTLIDSTHLELGCPATRHPTTEAAKVSSWKCGCGKMLKLSCLPP